MARRIETTGSDVRGIHTPFITLCCALFCWFILFLNVRAHLAWLTNHFSPTVLHYESFFFTLICVVKTRRLTANMKLWNLQHHWKHLIGFLLATYQKSCEIRSMPDWIIFKRLYDLDERFMCLSDASHRSNMSLQ